MRFAVSGSGDFTIHGPILWARSLPISGTTGTPCATTLFVVALIGLMAILGIIILIAGAVLLVVSLVKASGRRQGGAVPVAPQNQDLPMWTPPQNQNLPMWTPPQNQDVPLWSPPQKQDVPLWSPPQQNSAQQNSAQQPQTPYWSSGPR